MMSLLRSSLPALVAVSLIGWASAQTSQLCYDDQIALSTTNWSSSVSIPKFNPNLGDLVSVDLTLGGNVQGTARAESLDTSATQVTTQFSATITLTRPDSSVLVVALPIANFVDNFTSYDGTLDFAGTSGITHPGINASDTQSHTSPPPVGDLALFTGAGNIVLPVTAVGSSTATGSGNLITQFSTQAAATVHVCYNYIPNVPPTINCVGPLMGSVGVPISFQICASDSNPADTVTLTTEGLPAGATATPPLPTSGNPACTTIDWTPTNAQTGTTVIHFTATDTHNRTAHCEVSLTIAECHLLLSNGTGNASAPVFGHLYDTQLAGVRRSFPVTMESIPQFDWDVVPPSFVVQLVMFNPAVFPSNPSQWSEAMRVTKNLDGTVSTNYTGTMNGIAIRAQVATVNGHRYLKFPFRILGM